jgi:two-component system, sensor histidine kinase
MDDLAKDAAAPWDREDAASRSLLRLIVESTNDGIWDWDLRTDAVYYSPRWLELIGHLPGELCGHINTFIERLHPDDRAAVEQSIAEYRVGVRPDYRAEFRLRHKDGSWRSILTRGIVLRDDSGRAVRFAGTHTDVTDRVRAAERLELMVAERTTDLRAARDRAETANAATTKFLATASHDIRQPLQAMALLLGGLKGELTTSEGVRKLLAVERSLASGMELLDALLEFSKLDAGALRPRLTSVGVGDLFDVINDTFAVEAAQKKLHFTVMPTRLATRSDAQLLARILRNLVSNAIKYTDRGGVLIGCRRRGDRVRIEVWDTGCGIPADQQRQIFWEFVQVRERGRARSGLGLGLAIVDRLAKLLGHSIEIHSRPGRGSVFAVDMPFEQPPSPAASVVPAGIVPDAIFAGKLIAILEDDAAVTDALTELLREWGAAPIAASDDATLLRRLAGRRPDAIIADRDLGAGGDGFAALRRLEAALAVSLPALVLTGDYDVRDLERVNQAGRRVLHKPVWPSVLHAVLRFELSRLAEA